MNYLAHIYLADHGSEKLLLGNFLGDFVRKSEEPAYEDTIRQGIHMHRKIDSFTDSHPIFLISRRRVSDLNRRYAGVLVDMFYDHFLAKNWQGYSGIHLEKYVHSFYEVLNRNITILPGKLKRIMPYLTEENWLLNYREISGIEQAVNNIARRFAHSRRPMNQPIMDLINNYEGLENDFRAFFPQAVDYANQLIQMIEDEEICR
jgi:acyl carrier protein phosphodiesterase